MSSHASILIHQPGSQHPSLADTAEGFDRSWLMGRWDVGWSTLPMWKGKRDVRITYRPHLDDNHKLEVFDSDVESWKEHAAEESKPSIVRGVETLTAGANGATFDWQGKSYLFFVWSHWEILGYGKDEVSGFDWAVTFFSKTLFTPAGIDIYTRSTHATGTDEPLAGKGDEAARDALIRRVAEALQASQDQSVSELASTGFSIPKHLW